MSFQQTIRLATFQRARIDPILESFDTYGYLARFEVAEFFEAMGWLIEGVFCGFFDSREADIVWQRLTSLRLACDSRDDSLIGSYLATELGKIYHSHDPFRESQQMPDGAQKAFELPLFPHALHLSDELARDPLARLCCQFLVASNQGLMLMSADLPVDPEQVSVAVGSGSPTGERIPDLLAGFIRLLEHMEASRIFFSSARNRARTNSDFDSYRLRIGSLEAWRIPTHEFASRRRISELFDLLEFAIRTSARNTHLGLRWSYVEGPLKKHFKALLEEWESDHCSSLLEFA